MFGSVEVDQMNVSYHQIVQPRRAQGRALVQEAVLDLVITMMMVTMIHPAQVLGLDLVKALHVIRNVQEGLPAVTANALWCSVRVPKSPLRMAVAV